MDPVNNNLGNILIKHHDKFRGDYYLKDDLTFTTDRSLAAKFYLLRSGDSSILNGDRISINLGYRTLIIDDDNQVMLIDREHSYRNVNTVIITNGTDSTDPITFDSVVYLITDKKNKEALKYDWSLNLIDSNNSYNDITNYKPKESPILTIFKYGGNSKVEISSFEFILERADGPITNLIQQNDRLEQRAPKSFEGYSGALLILLLMIVLVLCLIISNL